MGYYICPKCGYSKLVPKYERCPNCNAKMDWAGVADVTQNNMMFLKCLKCGVELYHDPSVKVSSCPFCGSGRNYIYETTTEKGISYARNTYKVIQRIQERDKKIRDTLEGRDTTTAAGKAMHAMKKIPAATRSHTGRSELESILFLGLLLIIAMYVIIAKLN